MPRISIDVIDLVAKAPTQTMWLRIMGANFVPIMPQVVAAWFDYGGHDVTLVTLTGREVLIVVYNIPATLDSIAKSGTGPWMLGNNSVNGQMGYAPRARKALARRPTSSRCMHCRGLRR